MEISQAVCVANVPPAKAGTPYRVRFRGSMREDLLGRMLSPRERAGVRDAENVYGINL